MSARWLLFAVTLVGCGSSLESLKKRAAFDLECPAEQLVISDLGDETKGVAGCGRKATYIHRDTWLQNGATDPTSR